MSGGFKRSTFAAALAGFAAAAGAWQLGFVAWLPEATMADGRTAPYHSEDVQRCLKAEILALFDLPGAVRFWHVCQDDLIHGQALSGFELRALAFAGSGLVGLLALFAFALAVRFEQKPAKVVRGARLLTGRQGLRAFTKACGFECKRHGRGIELWPRHALDRERETRHFLILGSVGGRPKPGSA